VQEVQEAAACDRCAGNAAEDQKCARRVHRLRENEYLRKKGGRQATKGRHPPLKLKKRTKKNIIISRQIRA